MPIINGANIIHLKPARKVLSRQKAICSKNFFALAWRAPSSAPDPRSRIHFLSHLFQYFSFKNLTMRRSPIFSALFKIHGCLQYRALAILMILVLRPGAEDGTLHAYSDADLDAKNISGTCIGAAHKYHAPTRKTFHPVLITTRSNSRKAKLSSIAPCLL